MSNMNCEYIRKLLPGWLYDTLSQEDHALVEQHLKSCPECGRELEKISNRFRLLSGWEEEKPSSSLVSRTMEAIKEQNKKPYDFLLPYFRPAFVLKAAAAILVILFLYAISLGPGSQQILVYAQDELTANSSASIRIIAQNHENGKPIKNARISLQIESIKTGKKYFLYSGRTDKTGSLETSFKIPDLADGKYNIVVRARSRYGEDLFTRPVDVKKAYRIMLSTDKPVYQPDQTIHMRALVLNTVSCRVAEEGEMTFEVSDPKENKLFKKKVKMGPYGVASADFELAREITLGEYRIKSTIDGETSDKVVEVKKYALPKYRVSFNPARKVYLPSETVTGSVDAEYFFGKKVEGAQVTLDVSAFDVEFHKVASIKGKTDKDGKYSFSVPLPDYFVGQPLEKGKGVLKFDVALIDGAGHEEKISDILHIAPELPEKQVTRREQRGKSPITIDVIPERKPLLAGVDNIVYVVTTLPGSNPASCSVTLTAEGETARSHTDDMGVAEFIVTPRSNDVKVNVVGEKGASYYGEKEMSLSADTAAAQLLVSTDKSLYKVGEPLKITVLSPSSEGSLYLDIIRNGQTMQTKSLSLNEGRAKTEIDLAGDMWGTLQIHAYRMGTNGITYRDTRTVIVSQADSLKVAAKTDKKTYLPGDTARVDFKVVDDKGEPKAAALGINIVDESVYALAEKHPGLEKIYFALEKRLMEPTVEICKHNSALDLTKLAADPYSDISNQRAAGLILSSFKDLPEYKLSNSYPVMIENTRLRKEAATKYIITIAFLVILLTLVLICVWKTKNILGKSLTLIAGTISLIIFLANSEFISIECCLCTLFPAIFFFVVGYVVIIVSIELLKSIRGKIVLAGAVANFLYLYALIPNWNGSYPGLIETLLIISIACSTSVLIAIGMGIIPHKIETWTFYPLATCWLIASAIGLALFIDVLGLINFIIIILLIVSSLIMIALFVQRVTSSSPRSSIKSPPVENYIISPGSQRASGSLPATRSGAAKMFKTGWVLYSLLAVLAIIFMFIIRNFSVSLAYVPLYPASHLSASDVQEIQLNLDKFGIANQVLEGGRSIAVHRGDKTRALAKLADMGLPRRRLSEFYGDSMAPKTEQQYTEERKRQLEYEITDSLRQIQGVADARVRLEIPYTPIFSVEKQRPTAAIMLKLVPGYTLTQAQVQGIMNLVMYSVPDLSPENISIVDTNGISLINFPVMPAQGGADWGGGMDAVTQTQLKSKEALEKSLENKIQAALDKVLGPGHASVVVNAEMNYSQSETNDTSISKISTNVFVDQLTKDETSMLEEALKNAIGFDASRGDSISIISRPFSNTNMPSNDLINALGSPLMQETETYNTSRNYTKTKQAKRTLNCITTLEYTAKVESESKTRAAKPSLADILAKIRIRQFFPETLYWNPLVITGADGTAQIEVPVADTITTWKISTMASTRDGIIGTSSEPLHVFQEFFIDPDLPAELTRGDTVSIPVALYNYLPTAQTLEIELHPDDWYKVMDTTRKTVRLGPNDVSSVTFTFKVLRVGDHRMTVVGRSGSRKDAVSRPIRVVPDGREILDTVNGRLSGSVQHSVIIPHDSVPGGSTILVKVYPGITTQVIDGLEGMLQMPYGCFEQTTSITYPNVMVLSYLKETGRAEAAVQMKAESLINKGYQRLLTFEVPGGGFDWYGKPPASTLLTAYGLMEFHDMNKVYPIDEKVISRTQAWLCRQQRSDGSFKTYSKHGGDADNILRDSAYITWTLMETGYDGDEARLALSYLKQNMRKTDDPYTVALIANSLVLEDKDGTDTQKALKRLYSMASVNEKDFSWPSGMTSLYGAGMYADIEATALAVQAFLRSGKYNDAAQGGVNYLVNSRDAGGTWGTTQATVLALRTLVESMKSQGSASGRVNVMINGKKHTTFVITPENSDVLQVADLRDSVVKGDNLVELVPEGDGSFLYQVIGKHYNNWDKAEEPHNNKLSIDMRYSRTELSTSDILKATATLKNKGGSISSMIIADLGVPPGFTVLTGDLESLKDEGKIDRYELTDRQIIIYLRGMEPGRVLDLTFRMKARYPIRARTPVSRIYEYYNPRVKAESKPRMITVR